MRLFVAVSLPDELKEGLKTILEKLSSALLRDSVDVKWVKPEHIHFTLKFLGECPEPQIQEIVRSLESALQGIPPFRVRIGGLGCFPERGPVRILWRGLSEGADAMKTLAAHVESGCDLAGLPRSEHPFSAHLTLGRVKYLKHSGKIRSLLESYPKMDRTELKVDSVELIRSILSSKGPSYTQLKSIKLL